MKPECYYCNAQAIGTERDYLDSQLATINVCRNCAHLNTTVRLFSGGTWVRRSRRNADAQGGE
tara:strand:- start:11764 stop:11952 length:189 start_codon:yes stop_codon:yes gene_type:complete